MIIKECQTRYKHEKQNMHHKYSLPHHIYDKVVTIKQTKICGGRIFSIREWLNLPRTYERLHWKGELSRSTDPSVETDTNKDHVSFI